MKDKVEARHLLGIMVAGISFFLIHLGSVFLAGYLGALPQMEGQATAKLVESIGNILAVLVAVLLLYYFFYRLKNTLGIYLMLAVIVSLILVFAVIIASGFLISADTILMFLERTKNQVGTEYLLGLMGLAYVITLTGIFVVTFQWMIRRKVKYLKTITQKIQEMEQNGFGTIIEEKGNDELTQLSVGISKMSLTLKEKLDLEKQQEEQKIRLIADLSHDIRTPLTSVIGYTELLRENAFTEPDRCMDYVGVIMRRLSDMKNMVEQLFEYAKLNQVDYVLTKKTTELGALCRYIDSEYSRIYQSYGLDWKLELPKDKLYLELDQEHFMRAMGNLLDNARKYTKKGTEVCLKVQTNSREIVITLSNGIDSSQPLEGDKIFERFYKTNKARSGATGTGLGLPIVEKIIQLHDGTIEVIKTKTQISFQISFLNNDKDNEKEQNIS